MHIHLYTTIHNGVLYNYINIFHFPPPLFSRVFRRYSEWSIIESSVQKSEIILPMMLQQVDHMGGSGGGGGGV